MLFKKETKVATEGWVYTLHKMMCLSICIHTLGVRGLKITTRSQEPVNHIPIVKYKSFIKLLKVVVPDYGTFS